MIHATAIIDPSSKIGKSVEIGPYSAIGADVEIAEGTRIASHVVIKGPTSIGRNNHIYPFACIGEDPQDKKYTGEQESILQIGDGNTIREYCTVNRGTGDGGGVTRIGNDNWIMAYVHVAHDCIVGDNNVFANNTTLAGHVIIDDHVILGGFTGVHQFCRIGRLAFSAISSVIVKDVPPFVIVYGNTAKPNGLNREGLKRHDIPKPRIEFIQQAYKILYRQNLLLSEALDKLETLANDSEDVNHFLKFVRESKRGIVR
jgi:UDP-N-acetylglucosamine acyltransferase